jgi:hypothetical protein
MAGTVTWWGGERLPQGEIALAVFARQPKPESLHQVPLFGAAASGMASVLLFPTDFSRFLREHETATLICYDAAELHWLLEDHFMQSSDTQSSKVLWGYSADSRLVDVMLLDQHVRRCQGQDGTAVIPLYQLLRRHAGVELPNDKEIQQGVAAAWERASQDPNDPALELMSAVAAGILRAYEHLLAEAKIIEEAMEASQLPPVTLPAPAPAEVEEIAAQVQKLTETILARRRNATDSPAAPPVAGDTTVETPDRGWTRFFGPLGIGIDVQAAIALNRPGRPELQVDRQELDELCRKNDDRYRLASARLHADIDARSCFEWSEIRPNEKLVMRGDNGLPIYRDKALKAWLQGFGEKLRDIHNLPADTPITGRGDPSFDAERWGIWVACNRSLRAWRDLVRSARLALQLARVAPFRSAYDIAPVFRSRNPDLVALRSLDSLVFRPRGNRTFVVGTLPLLKIVCFAAVCQWDCHAPHGRLAGHFLECQDPIKRIASELYSFATGKYVPSAETDSDEAVDTASGPTFEEVTDHFADLEESDSVTYWHWIGVADALLETIPLGLPMELMRVFLEEEYKWHDVNGVEVENLTTVWIRQLIPEITEFLNDDVHGRLARVLGLA